jgi:hypothetical protein
VLSGLFFGICLLPAIGSLIEWVYVALYLYRGEACGDLSAAGGAERVCESAGWRLALPGLQDQPL